MFVDFDNLKLNRKSERIPRSKLRGMRANLKIANFLTVEDSLQLAAVSFNNQKRMKLWASRTSVPDFTHYLKIL